MTRRFALSAAAERVVAIGDQIAVFNAASFETHVCNEAAGALLELIAQAPLTADELASRLAEWLVPEQRASAAAHADSLVHQLLALGLVEEAF